MCTAFLGHLRGVFGVFRSFVWRCICDVPIDRSLKMSINMDEATDGKNIYSVMKSGEDTTKECKMRIDAMH